MTKYKPWKKRIRDFSPDIPRSIMMRRVIFRKEMETYADLSNSVWVYSMWKGYLERSQSLRRQQQWTQEHGIPFVFLHSSGHARLSDWEQLVQVVSPKILIPIHSYHR